MLPLPTLDPVKQVKKVLNNLGERLWVVGEGGGGGGWWGGVFGVGGRG